MLGTIDGIEDGLIVGSVVGASVGKPVGAEVGLSVGVLVGKRLGSAVGTKVGTGVGGRVYSTTIVLVDTVELDVAFAAVVMLTPVVFSLDDINAVVRFPEEAALVRSSEKVLVRFWLLPSKPSTRFSRR